VAEYAELKALLEPSSDALTLAAAGWLQIREDLTVYARAVQAADRTRVLVFSQRKGHILVAAKISERIGKIRQKYPGICSLYEIEIVLDETGQQVRDITWTKQERGEQRPVLATHQRMTVSLTNKDNELIQIRLSGMPRQAI